MSNSPGSVTPGTLRARLEDMAAQGRTLTVREAIAVIVPLCVAAAELHQRGVRSFLHPSSVFERPDGTFAPVAEHGQSLPQLAKDIACCAPEYHRVGAGDARASVYSVGAMLYEMVTGASVGPAMKRPRDVVPDIPASFESILGKALVSDPSHRPDDLLALAQAIHHMDKSGTVPPPPLADESHLDLDVDISMSMLPPAPAVGSISGTSPLDVAVAELASSPGSSKDRATNELAALKVRLESDPRPRYVVKKDGMDHGPFAAVELLQQIRSNTFVEEDVLHDNFSQDERPIRLWTEFAPFAEHARRHRDIAAEKDAIVKVVQAESQSTRGKAALGVGVVAAIAALGIVWFVTQKGSRSDEVAIVGDEVTNVETDQSMNVPKKKKGSGGGRRVVGSQGGIPILAGGMSCEGARAAYVEEINVMGKGQADITQGQYASKLNNGSYLLGCGIPDSTKINICAAVQNGRAVGVTVTTNPKNGGAQSCVAGKIRSMSFPSHPKLDVVRVSF